MADPSDDQDYFSGLGQGLLGNAGNATPPNAGLGATLAQGLTGITPTQFPAARLLGHVPTFAPPALGDSMPPVQIASQGNADDVSQAIGQALTEAQRPDIGTEGNLIRSLLPPGFSRDMFQNYWQGNGDHELSDDRFKDIADTASNLKPTHILSVTGPDGEPLQQRIYDFGQSPDYKLSLGSASLFYDQNGKPVGFYDNYDFDPSNGKRSLTHEAEVRTMHVLGPLHGAKDFQIKYGTFVPPT